MLKYYRHNPLSSFGFVAAPDINPNVKINKRFNFYRRFMLSLFGGDTFIQTCDIANNIYLLVNRRAFNVGLIQMNVVEDELSKKFLGHFSFPE